MGDFSYSPGGGDSRGRGCGGGGCTPVITGCVEGVCITLICHCDDRGGSVVYREGRVKNPHSGVGAGVGRGGVFSPLLARPASQAHSSRTAVSPSCTARLSVPRCSFTVPHYRHHRPALQVPPSCTAGRARFLGTKKPPKAQNPWWNPPLEGFLFLYCACSAYRCSPARAIRHCTWVRLIPTARPMVAAENPAACSPAKTFAISTS